VPSAHQWPKNSIRTEPHEATGSFEVGNPLLDQKTANQIEIGLHYHQGKVEAKVAAYFNRFDDFIYLAETGELDPEEGLPIRLWSQDDAEFRGIEGELNWTFAENSFGDWQLRAIGDLVDAQLRDGDDLPRIAPARLGADLGWSRGRWRASLGAIHYFEQDDVAEFEQATDGFTLVDAHVSYAFEVGPTEWEAFLDGSNLGDTNARLHTSLLRDRSPIPGLGIQFGLRTFF
jgi:iron complex outermembrane receptor protein